MTKQFEFTNGLGQIIRSGDTVIAVTEGWNHNINTRRGQFLYVKDGRCRVRVPNHWREALDTDGAPFDWNTHFAPYYVALKDPSVGHEAGREIYERLQKEANELITYKVHERWRISCLQLNRIYPTTAEGMK
jgi:hypothetical protein